MFAEFRSLCAQANKRKGQAFRPGTLANHMTMIKKYIKFCIKFKLEYINPSQQTVCIYIEQLAQQFKSYKSVANYVGAIRLLHKYMDIKAPAIDSFQVALMLRATTITMRNIPNRRPPISTQMMQKLCEICDRQGSVGLVIKLAILLGFLGFLRASNLCPKSSQKFDTSRHLTRSDVRVTTKGLIVRLKWSKTLQSANQPLEIPIPELPVDTLNAVKAFKRLTQEVPAQAHKPLFVLPRGGHLVIGQLRRAFKALLKSAGFSQHGLTLHSLRKGGASESHAAGARYLDIQRQGAWTSSCFYDYITRTKPHDSTVCAALVQAAQQCAEKRT